MNIGALLKYHRTKFKKTQLDISQGICSVSHYSKIEKNSKEVNRETLELIFQRLGIELIEMEEQNENIHSLLDELNTHIIYRQEEDASITYEKLSKMEELIVFTEYIYLYELYKFRYLLLTNKLPEVERQLTFLQKHESNFNQTETNIYHFFLLIFYTTMGEFNAAEKYVNRLIVNGKPIVHFSGDEYYNIGFVRSKTNIVEANIYLNQALNIYASEYNQKKVLDCLMLLGINYTALNVLNEAKVIYGHALRMAKDMQLKEVVLQIGVNIGYIYIQSKKYEKALVHLNKLTAQFISEDENYFMNIYSLAFVHYQMGNYPTAKKYFIKVQQNINKVHNLKKYYILSKLYLLLIGGQSKQVMEYYEQKVQPSLCNFDHYFMDDTVSQVKEIFIENNEIQKAKQLFK